MLNKFLATYHVFIKDPIFLWLLILLPIVIWLSYYFNKKRASVWRISSTEKLQKFPAPLKIRLLPLLTILRSIAFIGIVISLARPQLTDVSQDIDSNGIDIVLSLDISGSMLAEDFQPNRMEAVKATAQKFVNERPNDRIGVVIFAGESFTLCPITIDHNVVNEQISGISSGMLQDGTAIGMGLATAVDKLRNAKGKSRVIILMTDGINNTGLIDPQTALEIAKVYHIKIYTIGVGTRGQALYPVQTPAGIQKQMMPVEIDEPLLRKIASQTNGKYFRATDNHSLQEIYAEINKLEKTKVAVNAYTNYSEAFFIFLFIAIIALFIEAVLRYTYFKSIP